MNSSEGSRAALLQWQLLAVILIRKHVGHVSLIKVLTEATFGHRQRVLFIVHRIVREMKSQRVELKRIVEEDTKASGEKGDSNM